MRIITLSPDETVKCENGHEAVTFNVTYLNFDNEKAGTMDIHCCECKTTTRVGFNLTYLDSDKKEISS